MVPLLLLLEKKLVFTSARRFLHRLNYLFLQSRLRDQPDSIEFLSPFKRAFFFSVLHAGFCPFCFLIESIRPFSSASTEIFPPKT